MHNNRRIVGAMEVGDAINMAETDLRALIREVLGDGWLRRSKCDVARLEAKRDEERKRRPGVVVDEDLLVYTEFHELRDIVTRNWDDSAPVWRSKKYFEAVFDRLQDFRNPDAHSRHLVPFEEHLVLGLSGEIRNTITLYRSTAAVSGEYYPIVELIEDSLGNRFVPTAKQQTGSGFKIPATLAVGEMVTFKLKGWDPQGRSLRWLVTFHGKDPQRSIELDGAEVSFTWHISEDEVGENVPLIGITMMSAGNYHRNRTNDSFMALYISVAPPVT
jgi:hypothetical protein